MFRKKADLTFPNVLAFPCDNIPERQKSMDSIEEKILKIIAENRPDLDVTADAHFIEDGLLDSFDVLTLSAAFDKEFGISVAGTDIRPENFDTVAGMAALVRRNQK